MRMVLASASKIIVLSGPTAKKAATTAKLKRKSVISASQGHRLVSTADMRAKRSNTGAMVAAHERHGFGIWRVTVQIDRANRIVAIRSLPARVGKLCHGADMGGLQRLCTI